MLGITYVIIYTFRKIKTVISPIRAKVFRLKMLAKVYSPVPVSFLVSLAQAEVSLEEKTLTKELSSSE